MKPLTTPSPPAPIPSYSPILLKRKSFIYLKLSRETREGGATGPVLVCRLLLPLPTCRSPCQWTRPEGPGQWPGPCFSQEIAAVGAALAQHGGRCCALTRTRPGDMTGGECW